MIVSAKANNLYASYDFGSLDLNHSIVVGTTNIRENDKLQKFTIGSQINDRISIEGSYVDFGEIELFTTAAAATFTYNDIVYQHGTDTKSTVKYSIDAMTLGIRYNLYSDTTRLGIGNLYTLAGLVSWESNFDLTGITDFTNGRAASSLSEDSNDLYYGAGYNWQFKNGIDFHLEYVDYRIDRGKLNTDGLTFGLRYSFTLK